MGKASSAKKVARASRAGGRSAGTRQRNLLFPGAIVAIVLLGTGLVVFAVNERKTDESVAPVAFQDHWHAAYGVYVCGEWQPPLPEQETANGIHTHGDGVIHIHPFSEAAAGDRATLGVFLEDAGVEIGDDSLSVGESSWTEGEQDCDGEDAQLQVHQWADVSDEDPNAAVIDEGFSDVQFQNDGEGYTIAFVPEDTDVPLPETAANLQELGAVDAGTEDQSGPSSSAPPGSTGTTAGEGSTDTTAGGDATTTVPGDGATTTAGDGAATAATTGG